MLSDRKLKKEALIDIQLQTELAKKKAIELKKEIAALENQQKTFNRELKEAVSTEGKSSAAATKYAKALGLVQVKLKAARAAFNSYTKEVNKNNVAFTQQTNRTNGLTKALTGMAARVTSVTVLIMQMRRAIMGSIDAFATFEKSLANVQTLLTHNERTLEQGSIDIMRQYGFAIEDTNKAMFDAISAGIKATEVTDFLHEASRLAIGGVTDLTHSVKGLVYILNTYSLGVEHAKSVSDAFYSAQKYGVTTVQELVEHLGRVAPIANTAGISFQEMLGSLASLTKGGLKTEEAVTILRQVIAALIKPAHQASLVLKDAEVPTGVLALKTHGLVYALRQLNKAYEENPDAIARMIPNIRAFTGVAAFSTERLNELEMIIGDVYNDTTSLTRAFNEQMQTYTKQLDVFKARIRTIGIEIGRSLKPTLTSLMRWFNDLTDNTVPAVLELRRMNTEINNQVEVIQTGNFTLEERQTLMKQLNQNYAAYLPYLFKEEATLENIEKFQKAINSHMQSKILFSIYEEELAKIYAQQYQAQSALLLIEQERARRKMGQGIYEDYPAYLTDLIEKTNTALEEFWNTSIETTDEKAANIEERMRRLAENLGLNWDEIKEMYSKKEPIIEPEAIGLGGLDYIEKKRLAQMALNLRRKFEDAEIAIMENSAAKKLKIENLRYSRAIEDLTKEYIVKEQLNEDEIAVNKQIDALLEQNERVHQHNLAEIMQQASDDWIKEYRKNKQKEADEAQRTAEEIARYRKKYLGDTIETMRAEIAAFEANEHYKTLTTKEQEKARMLIRYKYMKDYIDAAISLGETVANSIFQVQEERAERTHKLQLQELQDQQDSELNILKNRLEQGAITEEAYKQAKAQSDERFRQREQDLERSKFEDDKRRNTQEAIIAGALAAARAIATYWATPQAWVMAGLAAAEAAAQVAVIQASQYAEGGITDGGMQNKPYLGLVGEAGPEWISPNWMLKDKVAGPIIESLEQYRKQGVRAFADGGLTARHITAPIDSAVMSQQDILALIKNQPPPVVIVKDILTGIDRVVSVQQRARV